MIEYLQLNLLAPIFFVLTVANEHSHRLVAT
jgi:hypothetical protein